MRVCWEFTAQLVAGVEAPQPARSLLHPVFRFMAVVGWLKFLVLLYLLALAPVTWLRLTIYRFTCFGGM